MAHCMRHYEEPVLAGCKVCGQPFCGRCLVFPNGPNKPAMCIGCALTASGVRNKGKVVVAAAPAPKVDRRAEKAQRKQEKETAKALKRAAKNPPPLMDPSDPRPSNVPVPKGLPTPSSRYAAMGSGDSPVS